LVAQFLPQPRDYGRKAPESDVTNHASHLGDHFLGLRRLAEKPAVGGNIDASSAGEKGSRIVPRPSTRR
jgi:hypothetical protein